MLLWAVVPLAMSVVPVSYSNDAISCPSSRNDIGYVFGGWWEFPFEQCSISHVPLPLCFPKQLFQCYKWSSNELLRWPHLMLDAWRERRVLSCCYHALSSIPPIAARLSNRASYYVRISNSLSRHCFCGEWSTHESVKWRHSSPDFRQKCWISSSC